MASHGNRFNLDQTARKNKIQEIAQFMANIGGQDSQGQTLVGLAQEVEHLIFTTVGTEEEYNYRVQERLSSIMELQQQRQHDDGLLQRKQPGVPSRSPHDAAEERKREDRILRAEKLRCIYEKDMEYFVQHGRSMMEKLLQEGRQALDEMRHFRGDCLHSLEKTLKKINLVSKCLQATQEEDIYPNLPQPVRSSVVRPPPAQQQQQQSQEELGRPLEELLFMDEGIQPQIPQPKTVVDRPATVVVSNSGPAENSFGRSQGRAPPRWCLQPALASLPSAASPGGYLGTTQDLYLYGGNGDDPNTAATRNGPPRSGQTFNHEKGRPLEAKKRTATRGALEMPPRALKRLRPSDEFPLPPFLHRSLW